MCAGLDTFWYLLSLQMASAPNVSDLSYDSDESVVKETCDEASPNNHSNEHSDEHELFPPLRRTKVLLTPLVRESLDALTEKRKECEVLCDNGYLFALPQSVHYIRASDCLRQFVKECDHIQNPKALTSTKLRKHIATLSTVLNLKTTELDQLADFLGHNIAVHRKHYRLPEGTLKLAKISKVLLAMEQGRLGEYEGKSLDEIQVDVNGTKCYYILKVQYMTFSLKLLSHRHKNTNRVLYLDCIYSVVV